jgi:cyclin B
MRFILKQYNIPKIKERSNKLLNLSLNYRQRSRNKDFQINPKRKKNYLNIPTGKEMATIIPINKKSSDYRYNYNHKSIDISIPYPYPININPQVPKEYIDDIYSHLKFIEYDDLPMKNYMNIIQTDINEKMRAILLDWLVEVHIRFNLLTETLFITINLIDKYLSKKNIHRKYLQLLGITALLIACKYEEIYPPEIKELILMTDNAYNKEQVLQMENEILHAVNFNVTFPTSLKFLEIFKNKLNLDEKNYHRCLYFIEVSLLDYKSSYFNPSLIASNSLYFNYMYMNKNKIDELNYDEKNIFDTTGYGKNDIVQCMNCLNKAFKNLEKIGNKYNSIRRKFKVDKYSNVSNVKYFIENEGKEISFNSE